MFFLSASLPRYIPINAITIATTPSIKDSKINPIIATIIATIPNTSAKSLRENILKLVLLNTFIKISI